jgi:hypothetical protein
LLLAMLAHRAAVVARTAASSRNSLKTRTGPGRAGPLARSRTTAVPLAAQPARSAIASKPPAKADRRLELRMRSTMPAGLIDSNGTTEHPL